MAKQSKRKTKSKLSKTQLKKIFSGRNGVILAVLLAIYSVYAYFTTGTIVPTAELIDGRATFRFVDVGQGDCVLVTYKGESVLVDAGPASSGEKTAEYVSMYSPHVDYFIITHPHEDHMGGAADVLESVSVDHLVMSTAVSGEEFYSEAVNEAKKQGCEIVCLTDGVVYDTGNITVTIYDLFDFEYDDLNNASLFVKIEVGGTSLLITGDAEVEEEAYAVSLLGDELDVDILKVGHHGSRTSTSEELLALVTPDEAVISCGLNNSYGHPTSEVLERLISFGTVIYRTDKEGTVILRGD